MQLTKQYFGLFFVACLLVACTTEIERIDVAKNENVFIKIDCKKHRQIDFYLDCDIEYSELPIMVMDFEFYKGEEQILKGGLDPLLASPKSDEVKTEVNGITHWKFYGKLAGNFIPPEDGIFTIHPTLIRNNYPDLKVNKFELVLVR
tara:strand:+ start:1808 stop:2248 length:441 start_codon:yes stop_codon:yes gene_type:complete